MTTIATIHKHLHSTVPFEYGKRDCCTWVADCVLELTGKDFIAEYRGTYKTEYGAMKVLARHGGMVQLLSKIYGKAIRVEAARPGDIVVIDLINGAERIGLTCGLCTGDRAVFLTAQVGFVSFPVLHCIAAWRAT